MSCIGFTVSSDRILINNKLRRMGKEVAENVKILSLHLSAGTEKIHRNPQTG
jgi:hypothetical protein